MDGSDFSFRVKQLKSIVTALSDAASLLPAGDRAEQVQCLAATAEQLASGLVDSLTPAALAAS